MIVSLAAAFATGCTTPSYDSPPVVLRAADGALWLEPDEIDRFQCELGVLVCTAGTGRTSRRLCRCEE